MNRLEQLQRELDEANATHDKACHEMEVLQIYCNNTYKNVVMAQNRLRRYSSIYWASQS